MTNLHLNEQSIARFVPSPTPSTTPLHHHQSAMMPNHHQQHHHNINHNISLNHASNHLLANQQTDAPLSHYSNNPSTSLLSSSSIAPPNPPINAARVLQRNLMYVVGLPSSLAKEEILKRKDYFGKFGKIVKIAISKKTVNNKEAGNVAGLGGGERALYSAYVTFKRPEDCSAAIRQINGCQLGGVIVRATYGTNKYCSFWLKGQQCNNGSCLYLHSSASDQECCSKDDLLLMDKLAKINVFVEPDDLMHGKMAINRLIHSLTQQQLIAFVQLGQSINIYQLNYLQFMIPLLAEIAKLEPEIARLQTTQQRTNPPPQLFNATPYTSHHHNNGISNNNNNNSNSSIIGNNNGGQMNHSYTSIGTQQRGVTAPPGFNHNLSSIEALGLANNNERLSPYNDTPLPASSSWSSGHNQNYPYAQRANGSSQRSPPSPPPAIGRRANPTSAPSSASNTPYYSHLDYPRSAHYDHNINNNNNNNNNNYNSSHSSNHDYDRQQLSYNNSNNNSGPQYFQEKDDCSAPHHQHSQSLYAQSSNRIIPNTDRSFNNNNNNNTNNNSIAINPRRATYPYPNGVGLLNENVVVDDDSERYSNISDTNSNSSGGAMPSSSSSFSSTPSVSPYTNSSLSSLFQNFHLNQAEQEREKRPSDSYSLFAASAPSSTNHSPSRIISKSISPLSVGSGQGHVNGASLMLPPSLTSLHHHHHNRLEENHLINMQFNHNNTISASLSLNAPTMSKEEENKLKQFHDEWAQHDEKNNHHSVNNTNNKHDYFSAFQSSSSPVIRSATSIRGSVINNNNNNNNSNSNHNTPLIPYSQKLHAPPAVHDQYYQTGPKVNDHSLDGSMSSIFNNVQF